jgi:hypothetical protein
MGLAPIRLEQGVLRVRLPKATIVTTPTSNLNPSRRSGTDRDGLGTVPISALPLFWEHLALEQRAAGTDNQASKSACIGIM